TPVSPVSSWTSRTAATIGCSRRSSFPLGSVQSPYRGRFTNATSIPDPVSRHGTPPAARTSRILTVPPGPLRSRQPLRQPAVVGACPHRGELRPDPVYRGPFAFEEPARGDRERMVVRVGMRDREPGLRGHRGVLVLAEQLLYRGDRLGQPGRGTAEYRGDGFGRVPRPLGPDADLVPFLVRRRRIELPGTGDPVRAERQLPPRLGDQPRQAFPGRQRGARRQQPWCRRGRDEMVEQFPVPVAAQRLVQHGARLLVPGRETG